MLIPLHDKSITLFKSYGTGELINLRGRKKKKVVLETE